MIRTPTPRVHLQFLIVLIGTSPLVWRRIRIASTATFWDLHVAIQDAMGWSDTHLHVFTVPSAHELPLRIGVPGDDDSPMAPTMPGRRLSLDGLVSPYAPPMQYEYDFGDGWSHVVAFEDYVPAPGRSRLRPECVEGAGRCPPEDCGGVSGYAELLAIMADPAHEEHHDTVRWAGGVIDPHAFDAAAVRFSDPEARWRRANGGAE